jgi:hypothetical protein
MPYNCKQARGQSSVRATSTALRVLLAAGLKQCAGSASSAATAVAAAAAVAVAVALGVAAGVERSGRVTSTAHTLSVTERASLRLHCFSCYHS